jgi:uncharacterized protein YecE (DUF72 family)
MEPVSAQFLIGTSGWTYDDWKGRFYPEKLPKSRWLAHYLDRFRTVEINATFYRFFEDSTYLKWRAQAPAGFRYVLKAPRLITHLKQLEGAEETIRTFWNSAELLGDRLGLILLQIAPQTPYDPGRLRAALQAFPDPAKVAVEFRKEDWLVSPTFDLLEAPTGYLRLHGRGPWYAYNYNEDELQEIARTARDMAARGAQQVYIFFNNDYNARAPENARRVREILGA